MLAIDKKTILTYVQRLFVGMASLSFLKKNVTIQTETVEMDVVKNAKLMLAGYVLLKEHLAEESNAEMGLLTGMKNVIQWGSDVIVNVSLDKLNVEL